MNKTALGTLFPLLLAAPGLAQVPYPGETLISPLATTETFLIDMAGNVTKTWHGSSEPASIAYLLEDGSIVRPGRYPGGQFSSGGAGGRIQWIDANDNLVWDFLFADSDHQQHHDIEPLPNGNVLLIAWERKSNAEVVAAGRQSTSSEMWPTLIVEVEPVGSTGGNIVWEWHLWDHIVQDVDPAKPNYGVVADHPELIDINFGPVGGGPFGSGDWIHANAIDYNADLDQIVFSSPRFSEIFVIDHSTTTVQAAGHTGGNGGMGGDILYRWGNPQAYDRGSASDR
ncbi:MAG: aryl-sulfate sulfotransferase, partial [Candidatus Krumholzibacteriia bacterium]